MCDKKVPNRVKGKIFKTVVQPAMLFSIGTVPLSKRQESKLEVGGYEDEQVDARSVKER